MRMQNKPRSRQRMNAAGKTVDIKENTVDYDVLSILLMDRTTGKILYGLLTTIVRKERIIPFQTAFCLSKLQGKTAR